MNSIGLSRLHFANLISKKSIKIVNSLLNGWGFRGKCVLWPNLNACFTNGLDWKEKSFA